MRHPSSTRRRTQRPCRCRPPSFQANSKSLLTTSRDSLHLLSRLKRPKSPKILVRSNRTSSQLPNQSKMSRRKTKEVPRVQEAKKRTRRKSTTTELSVPRQLLVEGKNRMKRQRVAYLMQWLTPLKFRRPLYLTSYGLLIVSLRMSSL